MGADMRDGVRRSLRTDPVLIALGAAALAVVPFFASGLGGSRATWGLQTVFDVADIVLAVRLARITAGERYARRFWRTVTITVVSCTIGDTIQTVRILLDPDAADVALAQTGFVVAGMALLVAAMLCHP